MNKYRRLQVCLYVAVAITCSLTLHILSQPASKYATRKDRSLPQFEIKVESAQRPANKTYKNKIAQTTASGEVTSAAQTQQTGFLRPRFTYFREPELIFNDSCEHDKCGPKIHHKWSMVNFIKSAAGNFIRRELLRRTWGSMRHVDSGRFATVFVIGKSEGMTNKLLIEEGDRYGDLLLFNGPDDYQSMPMKTMAGMQWAIENLPSDYFYSSGDDDFMVNVGRLQEIIDEGRRNVTDYNWPEFPIICTYRTINSAQPYRNKTGIYKKWYISEQEYKWPYYPKSCLGGFYTTRLTAVAQLFEESRHTPHLSVDDVWITGILREKMGMPDDMVVTPNATIAHHFLGYKRKRSDIKIGFMKNEWAKIKNEFKIKQICTC